MKIETSYEGQVEVYLLDKDTRDVYRWVSPENEPRETGIAPGEVSDFVSAMTMAEGISFFNPTIIGSENLDGKDCLVVEYVVGAADDITIKAWLWKEKRFLVRQDLISSQGTTTIEFRNIYFGDIPDSVFELPAPIITSPTMTLPSTDTTRVTFPDANLEAAIRDTINKPEGLIYIYNLESFTMLEAAQRGISVLNGLEYCVNLKYLNLGENNISDISVLDGLTNLQTLSLFNNNISDISRLAGLTNLENLHLANNNISDISALAGLTNLKFLNLNNNNINDISALAGLTNLEVLVLNENNISDISPLVELTNLTNLILSENDLDLLEGSEDMADIKALQDRGTTVTY